MKPIIVADNITKEYKVTVPQKGFLGAIKTLFSPEKKITRALNGVTFTVDENEILGFLGPNGAGKSTMVKILTGILTPTSGYASVSGIIPYSNPKQNAHQIGVVFGQRSRLWWNLPVEESFNYTRALYSIPNSIYQNNLRWFIENFRVDEIMSSTVRTLSLGQKMRAEIAMSMLHSPKILFLDEPTIGLDVVGKNELHNLVEQLRNELGITVLLVTHDILDIERLCSRVIVIDEGSILWQGSIPDLKHTKGGEKTFNVLFQSEVSPIESSNLKVIRIDGLYHSYSCSNSNVLIDELIKEIFNAGTVSDLTIKDVDLDVVMRRLYLE